MFRKLLPKKPQFFTLFSRQAAFAVEGARALRGLLTDLGAAEKHATEIRQIEHRADAVHHETMALLHSSFITPLERGDIHHLTSQLDDIMDHIEATAQRLWLYEIQSPTPEVGEMGELLERATEAVERAVGALAAKSSPEQIRELCSEVKALEKANDRLLRKATAKLFKEEQDAKALFKWQKIYDDIEDAIDRCQDVAGLIEGVALENS